MNEQTISSGKQMMAILVMLATVLVLGALVGNPVDREPKDLSQSETSFRNQVIPAAGVELPVTWDDLGQQMVAAGVIDPEKFDALYAVRGGLDQQTQNLVYGDENKKVILNEGNAGVLLNLLWAFGLANKNEILETGPMMDPAYGGDAGRFASTGGWSLAQGQPLDHYSRHAFVTLTAEQQERVVKTAQGIYRPCCGNSTYFPDCNHGMAMLGLLELLAREDLNEDEMYDIALAANAYWFPETYLTLATFIAVSKKISTALGLGI